MKSLVIGNLSESDTGVLGEFLTERGFVIEILDREYPDNWPSLGECDLVVSLGSSWSTYWREVKTSADAESSMLTCASRLRIPVLAICYGAQLLAQAFGGSVQKSLHPEVGWCHVEQISGLESFAGPWMQWHYDVFSVPKNASLLAANCAGPQAFTIGTCLGVQFHPEVTLKILESWINESTEEDRSIMKMSAFEFLESSKPKIERSKIAFETILDWHLSSVSSSQLNSLPGDDPK